MPMDWNRVADYSFLGRRHSDLAKQRSRVKLNNQETANKVKLTDTSPVQDTPKTSQWWYGGNSSNTINSNSNSIQSDANSNSQLQNAQNNIHIADRATVLGLKPVSQSIR